MKETHMIVIYSENESGSVGLSEALVHGNAVPSRLYTIDAHLLVVDGAAASDDFADLLASHDAHLLLALDGYRLATPDEANQAVAKAKKATTVQESGNKGKKSDSNGG